MADAEPEPIAAIHLDAVGGVAGDMFAAAILDTRPDLWPTCAEAVAALNLPDGVAAAPAPHTQAGFAGTRFAVDLPAGEQAKAGDHVHWANIQQRLRDAGLADPVRDAALAIFTLLAEAEAAVHGIDTDAVAFHEVGALDSIVDIVVAAALITGLGPCRWTVGSLPRGRGQVMSRHGALPLPAPATARLLQGFILVDDGEEGERITPTGAAILKYLAPSQVPDATPRVLVGVGTGLGTRTLKSRANMLRATLYADVATGAVADSVEVLRCEIDDQTAEDLAVAVEHLRETDGVLDVCQWPVFGKKGRVATALQVLARPPQSETIIAAMLRETTTLGVRRQAQARAILERRDTVVDGIGVKIAERPGGATAKAAMDDVAATPSAQARLTLKQGAEARALAEDGTNAE